MRFPVTLSLTAGLVLAWAGALSAQTTLPALPTPTAVPHSPAQDGGDDDDAPFKPHWENLISAGTVNQQGGQAIQTFSYTGTYAFSESGDFLAAELSGSRQKIEGNFSKTGGIALIGGLGWGAFSPSLSLGFTAGEDALHQFDGSLSLAFQANDNLSLDLSIGGNAGDHQGDVSEFYPSLAGTVRIDTAGANSSFGISYMFLDWFTASLTSQYTYDETYRIELVNHPNLYAPVNQVDQTASLTLGLDFTILKDLTLDLLPQVGQEYQPAGAVYSPQAGGLVVNSVATTQNFVGGSSSLSLRFQ